MSLKEQNEKPRVLVMMATYNGERYLREQIDSILAQKGVEVTLWIRDDISSDATPDICLDYQARDSRVGFKVNSERLGVALNFMQMVYEAPNNFDYYAFSDQDDVWLEDKLSVAINSAHHAIESGSVRFVKGFGHPVLYCSDVCDVDSDLSNPRRELKNLRLDTNKRATPLIRNYHSGCTMLFNADMLHLACKHQHAVFPRIHDVYFYCVSYYAATTVVDEEVAYVLRRITGANVAGELTSDRDFGDASLKRLITVPEGERKMTAFARMLLHDFGDLMNDGDRRLIESFCSYGDSLFSRIRWVLSRDYQCLSWRDSLLKRSKFLFKRY